MPHGGRLLLASAEQPCGRVLPGDCQHARGRDRLRWTRSTAGERRSPLLLFQCLLRHGSWQRVRGRYLDLHRGQSLPVRGILHGRDHHGHVGRVPDQEPHERCARVDDVRHEWKVCPVGDGWMHDVRGLSNASRSARGLRERYGLRVQGGSLHCQVQVGHGRSQLPHKLRLRPHFEPLHGDGMRVGRRMRSRIG